MPPPGPFPPGYAYEHIPPRFMQKKALPAGADSNVRPYVIFFSYMLLCCSLTVFIIRRLIRSYTILHRSTTARGPSKKHVQYFTLLAVFSLATTWYYMFRYFQQSYRVWLMWRSIYEVDLTKHHWGLWLKETSLFREAWEIAIIGSGRYWWTQQIFFFACGLGLYMDYEGIRRGVRHTWAFMLLGQVVAISFATNLFLLAVLLSPTPPSTPSNKIRRRNLPWLVNLTTVIATVLPAYLLGTKDYWYTPEFMTVLLVPHVVLLVMPLARVFLPAKYFTDDYVEFTGSFYTTLVAGVLLTLKQTVATYNYNGLEGVWLALHEHPAVSSVGHDVIMCWITWIVWCNTQSHVSNNAHIAEEKSGAEDWTSAGSGTAVVGGDAGASEVRRR